MQMSGRRHCQCLIQIGDDVRRIFDADRQAHHIRGRPYAASFSGGNLAVRG